MGQDLRKMLTVLIDGDESVRSIQGFVWDNRYGQVPIPVLDSSEVYFVDGSGIPHIINISDMFPFHGKC